MRDQEPAAASPAAFDLGRLSWPVSVAPDVLAEFPTTTFFHADRPLNMFSAAAHHAPAFRAIVAFGRALGRDSNFSARERELMILQVAASTECAYEWTIHANVVTTKLGFTNDELKAIQAGHATRRWSDREAVLLDIAAAVCRTDRLGVAEWQVARSQLSEAELVEALCLIGYYRLLAGLANTTGIPADDISAILPP